MIVAIPAGVVPGQTFHCQMPLVVAPVPQFGSQPASAVVAGAGAPPPAYAPAPQPDGQANAYNGGMSEEEALARAMAASAGPPSPLLPMRTHHKYENNAPRQVVPPLSRSCMPKPQTRAPPGRHP